MAFWVRKESLGLGESTVCCIWGVSYEQAGRNTNIRVSLLSFLDALDKENGNFTEWELLLLYDMGNGLGFM